MILFDTLLKLADQFEQHVKNIYLKERKRQDPDADESFHQEMLMQLGIVPLITSGDNAYLGEGAYSYVYRVLYKGKPAVAKVSTNKQDSKNLINLHNLKNSLGPLGKHIATVYDWFEYPMPDVTYYITVVEELVPLNPHVRASLFSIKPKNKQSLLGRFKDKFFVNDFVNNLFNGVNPPKSLNPPDLKRLKNSLNLLFLQENFPTPLSWDYLEKLLSDMYSLILGFLPKELEEDDHIFLNFVYLKLKSSFRSLLFDIDKIFPIEPQPASETWAQSLPESKSIMKLLYILKGRGIEWADLHGANLMERPGTRDIVISDPGLFNIAQ